MLREDVIVFLKTNPNPTDKEVHDWANVCGYDIHIVEREIYRLATKYVDLLFDKGGL